MLKEFGEDTGVEKVGGEWGERGNSLSSWGCG